jgi:hypothetical protein
MLHAYFRPDSQVLFSVFDSQLACPAPGVTRDGSSLDAQPDATRAPATSPERIAARSAKASLEVSYQRCTIVATLIVRLLG